MQYIQSICATLGIPLNIQRFYSDEYEDVLILYYIGDTEVTEVESFLQFLSGYLFAMKKLQEK